MGLPERGKGRTGRDPQVSQPIPHGVCVTAVGTPQITFQHPPLTNLMGEEDEPILRPATRADQSIGEEDVHGRFKSAVEVRELDPPRRPRTVLGPLTRAL